MLMFDSDTQARKAVRETLILIEALLAHLDKRNAIDLDAFAKEVVQIRARRDQEDAKEREEYLKAHPEMALFEKMLGGKPCE